MRPVRCLVRALVLAGGGMRGAYTSGVTDAIAEMGVSFDALYGTSAGAGNAAWYAAGQTDVCIRSWAYAMDPRILNLRRFLLRQGPWLDLDQLFYHVYPNELGFDEKAVKNSKVPLWITATSVRTGYTHFFDLRTLPHILTGLRATSALPLGTGGPVQIYNELYFDGGLTTPLPIVKAINDGATDIVVVLNKPQGERRPEPWPLSWYMGKQYPALGPPAREHHRIINDCVALAYHPPTGVHVRIIRPQTDLGLSRLGGTLGELAAAIERGRQDAHRVLT